MQVETSILTDVSIAANAAKRTPGEQQHPSEQHHMSNNCGRLNTFKIN